MPVVKRISTYDPLTFFMLHPRNSQVKLRIEDLYEHFKALGIPSGNCRLYYKNILHKKFKKARTEAHLQLIIAWFQASNILIKKQHQARTARVKEDVKKLTCAFDGAAKKSPEVVVQETDAEWDKAEKRHKKNLQGVQDMAVLMLDTIYTAEKKPLELLDLLNAKLKFIEYMGYEPNTCSLWDLLTGGKKVSLCEVLQEEDPEILSTMGIKIQHLFQQFGKAEKDLKEPCETLRQVIEPLLETVHSPRRRYDIKCILARKHGQSPKPGRLFHLKKEAFMELKAIQKQIQNEPGLIEKEFRRTLKNYKRKEFKADMCTFQEEAEERRKQRDEKMKKVTKSWGAKVADFLNLRRKSKKLQSKKTTEAL